MVIENLKKMKIALHQSQREIHTVAARAEPGLLRFKVSAEGLSAEIDILQIRVDVA